MASSGNFCTLNPLNNRLSGDSGSSKVIIANGNLSTEDQGSYYSNFVGTHAVSGTGKFYYEYKVITAANNGNRFGFIDLSTGVTNVVEASGQYPGSIAASWTANNNGSYSKIQFSNNNSTFAREYTGGAQSANDIWCIGLDLSTGKWYVSKNAALDPSSAATSSTSSGTLELHDNLDGGLYAPSGGEQAGSDSFYNFGQDGSFGTGSGGGNADANGFGDFAYAVPSEYLAICSGNLGVSSDIDPAQDNQPSKYFDAVIYTGNGSTQNITSLEFQPDITIIKNRDQSDSWCNQNSTLGVGKTQAIDSSSAVASETDCVTAFNSDGFSLGSNHKVNANSEKYVAYCWKKSADAGLDIVSYSGNGGTQAISHGLGVVPKMIWIFLNTGSSLDSICYINTRSMGTAYGIFPSLTNAKQNSTYVSATSSSTFTVTTAANSSGRTYFAYVWAEKEGFSSFKEYEGNANNDGTFIYSGHLGKFTIIKNLDASQHWVTHDSVRETFNPMDTPLDLDDTYAEYTSSARAIDNLSNGIKCRTSDGEINSSESFICLSWSSVPFKYNNTF